MTYNDSEPNGYSTTPLLAAMNLGTSTCPRTLPGKSIPPREATQSSHKQRPREPPLRMKSLDQHFMSAKLGKNQGLSRRGSMTTTESTASTTIADMTDADLDKCSTLQSIQRLSRHLPYCVVDTMIESIVAGRQAAVEAAQNSRNDELPFMNLELNVGGGGVDSMNIASLNAGSSNNYHSTAGSVHSIGCYSRGSDSIASQKERVEEMSIVVPNLMTSAHKSIKSASTLLETLEQLDGLLDSSNSDKEREDGASSCSDSCDDSDTSGSSDEEGSSYSESSSDMSELTTGMAAMVNSTHHTKTAHPPAATTTPSRPCQRDSMNMNQVFANGDTQRSSKQFMDSSEVSGKSFFDDSRHSGRHVPNPTPTPARSPIAATPIRSPTSFPLQSKPPPPTLPITMKLVDLAILTAATSDSDSFASSTEDDVKDDEHDSYQKEDLSNNGIICSGSSNGTMGGTTDDDLSSLGSESAESSSEDDSESYTDSYSDFADFIMPRSPHTASVASGGSGSSGGYLPGSLSGHGSGGTGGSLHGSLHMARRSSIAPIATQEVAKLRQGRLAMRQRNETGGGNDNMSGIESGSWGQTSNLSGGAPSKNTTGSTSIGAEALLQSSSHTSAVAFIDISGFTKLSRSLAVEPLSKTINNYFEMICRVIDEYGGDILKFAGDALLVEWQDKTSTNAEGEDPKTFPVALSAALCTAKLVETCSDHECYFAGRHIATLNLHCAIAFGPVVAVHLGDADRMEFTLLGSSIKQIATGMDKAALGEVAASPELLASLKESASEYVELDLDLAEETAVIAFKESRKFRTKFSNEEAERKLAVERQTIEEMCRDWNLGEMEKLQHKMSRYVHAVIYADEFSAENEQATMTVSRRGASAKKRQQTAAELRDVFTVFIQPVIDVDLMGENAGDQATLELLNNLLLIVNSEVAHFKGQLRQFIVDDKGLVIIANFGLRGSTFPNMINERAVPCISNIKTLYMTELGIECKMGATAGEVYCGTVGSIHRHEYAVLGPSVNLAARLMCNTSNPGILVDEQVRAKSDQRPFKSLEPIKAKGYDNLVKIFSPSQNVRKAWREIEDFVGREDYLASLKKTAESVMGDKISKIVFTSAPYGIGKSCLLSRATAEIESSSRSRKATTHISRKVFCEDDSFKPFSIVRPVFMDILRQKQHKAQFGNTSTAGVDQKGKEAENLEEASLYVALLQTCLEAGINLQSVEVLAGLIFSNKLSDIGTWSDRGQKMSEWNTIATCIVTAYIHCTKSFDLVLLALDDVSGLDEMSWKILQQLHRRSKNLLVIATARNEFDLNINQDFWEELNEWGIESGEFRHLRLAPMDDAEIAQLACKRLAKDIDQLEPNIGRALWAQSRGSPLLACQILEALYKDNRDGVVMSESDLTGVQEILLNRIDTLCPRVRTHLSLGAILGSTFNVSDVVDVMERYNDIPEEESAQHAESVVASLDEAVENGILIPSENSDYYGVYAFSHRLWKEVIGKQILTEWKQEMWVLIASIRE